MLYFIGTDNDDKRESTCVITYILLEQFQALSSTNPYPVIITMLF